MVGHLRPVHPGDGTDKLMGHGPDRRQAVFHSEINIACAHEASLSLGFHAAVPQSPYDSFLSRERRPAPCPEIAETATGFKQAPPFLECLLIISVVIQSFRLAGHDVIKFGDNRQHLDLEQYGAAPATLEFHREMARGILTYADKTPVISETTQILAEPGRNVAAPRFQKIHFLIGYDHIFEHGDLFRKLCGEARRIDGIVSVHKTVSHLRAGIIVYNRATHGEFI